MSGRETEQAIRVVRLVARWTFAAGAACAAGRVALGPGGYGHVALIEAVILIGVAALYSTRANSWESALRRVDE